jgi:hypothetical protein
MDESVPRQALAAGSLVISEYRPILSDFSDKGKATPSKKKDPWDDK